MEGVYIMVEICLFGAVPKSHSTLLSHLHGERNIFRIYNIYIIYIIYIYMIIYALWFRSRAGGQTDNKNRYRVRVFMKIV